MINVQCLTNVVNGNTSSSMAYHRGSCPNEQGHTDFSSVMIDDSPTLASVQTKVCQTAPNSDCMKCGGHEIDPARWVETLEYFGEDMRNITGRTGSIQNSAGIFFEPFQFFIRSILTQLKSNIKNQISDFLTEHFSGQPVISVHHRHGNGELDDFTNKETGAPAGRLNKNNTKVYFVDCGEPFEIACKPICNEWY